MQAAGKPRQLDLLDVEAEVRCDPGAKLGDAGRVTARVRVAPSTAFARLAAAWKRRRGRGRARAGTLGELDDFRAIDVNAVLAMLLGL